MVDTFSKHQSVAFVLVKYEIKIASLCVCVWRLYSDVLWYFILTPTSFCAMKHISVGFKASQIRLSFYMQIFQAAAIIYYIIWWWECKWYRARNGTGNICGPFLIRYEVAPGVWLCVCVCVRLYYMRISCLNYIRYIIMKKYLIHDGICGYILVDVDNKWSHRVTHEFQTMTFGMFQRINGD